jgi:hypothetical protein
MKKKQKMIVIKLRRVAMRGHTKPVVRNHLRRLRKAQGFFYGD